MNTEIITQYIVFIEIFQMQFGDAIITIRKKSIACHFNQLMAVTLSLVDFEL